MALPKTFSTGARSRGLPVDGTIDYATNGPDDPQGEWPPLAIKSRMDRLSWLWELFHGDFDDLRENVRTQQNQTTPVFRDNYRSQYTVQANPFRMVPCAIADILMMSPPEYPDPRQANNINKALYDILVHQYVYGASVVLATRDAQNPLQVLEPAWWVPTNEGWWYAEPIADSNGNYLSVNVLRFDGGWVTNQTYQFGGTYWSNIGSPIGDETEATQTDNPVRVICRSPRHVGGMWGTSILEDLASPAAQINKRYSDIDKYLTRQVDPTFTYRIADGDRTDIDPNLDTDAGFDEAADDLDKALSAAYNESDHWALPNAIQGMEAVTWDAGVGEAMLMIEHLQTAVEAAASIPGLFTGFSELGGTSALDTKRRSLRLYASSLHTQKATEVAVNELLAMSNVAPLDWPNALDAMEQATTDAEAPDEEGMLQ